MCLADEKVLATDEGGIAYAINIKTGASLVYTAPYARPSAATVESSPILAGDLIIFGASDGYLYAIDKSNGRILTKINLGAPVWNRVCLKDNNLFVADFSGNLSCFSLLHD